MQKEQAVLLSGNEAVAQAAWEAGVKAACGNVKTAEIMQCLSGMNVALFPEKEDTAAFETAAAGARGIICLENEKGYENHAADAARPGANAGRVVVCADGFAGRKLPVLEPADSAECLSFTKLAFEVSERLNTPVLLRLTANVAHTRSAVFPGPSDEAEWKETAELETVANRRPVNRTEMRETSMGVVVSGSCYSYVREAMPNASALKVGMVYPPPMNLIREFAQKVDRLMVVERGNSRLGSQIRAADIPCQTRTIAGGHEEWIVPSLRQTLETSFEKDTATFDLAMTGGSEVLLASRILGNLALKAGRHVKIGAVRGCLKDDRVTFVRMGTQVHSPIVEAGRADALLAFDGKRTAFAASFLKPDGVFIANRRQGGPASLECKNAGEAALALLGRLSRHLSFSEEEWLHEIARCVPRKTFPACAKAFRFGRSEMN